MGKVIGAPFRAIGSLLGLGGSKAAPAASPGPIVMPLPDNEAVMRAKRRSIAGQLQRGGRSSTILTDQPGSKLGGP